MTIPQEAVRQIRRLDRAYCCMAWLLVAVLVALAFLLGLLMGKGG